MCNGRKRRGLRQAGSREGCEERNCGKDIFHDVTCEVVVEGLLRERDAGANFSDGRVDQLHSLLAMASLVGCGRL